MSPQYAASRAHYALADPPRRDLPPILSPSCMNCSVAPVWVSATNTKAGSQARLLSFRFREVYARLAEDEGVRQSPEYGEKTHDSERAEGFKSACDNVVAERYQNSADSFQRQQGLR